MGSSATGVRGWRPRRCRSRRATLQPEAQVSDSQKRAAPLHTAVHRGSTAGLPGGDSRAGGAVRTGPRGPRPFSRSRICLSGNPAPPQDGVRPGAQAAPGTAPSHQAPRPSLSAPSAGEPWEGERTTDPGGLRAVPPAPYPRGRGVWRAEPLCPPRVDSRLWEEQRAVIIHQDHLPRGALA